jgi:pimeloyl-ACP methyl ester carboxylesterase
MQLNFKQMGQGPALVILHGFLGSSDNWVSLARNYFAPHYTVYLVDARNHGESPHDTEHSYPTMVADLLEFLNTHSIDKAIIMGHSMGGKTAMLFACENPDRIEKLIVVDMMPGIYEHSNLPVVEAMRKLDFDNLKSRKEADEALTTDLPSFTLRQFVLKNIYWETKERLGWRPNLKVLADTIDHLNEALSPDHIFTGPALFVRGELSDYIKGPEVADINLHFPNAVIETIDGAGHWVQAEKPEEFCSTVLKWLGANGK